MGFGVALSLAVGLLVAGANAPASDAASNPASLDGVWYLTRGAADGQPLPESEIKGGKLKIDGEHYTLTLPEYGTIEGTQKLGEANGVKTIDVVDAVGPTKGQTCLGIYELHGDEFRVAFALPGKPRPTSFETQPGSGQWMHVWQRAAK